MRKTIILIFLLLLTKLTYTQEIERLQSIYIFNFIRLIQWPISSNYENFIILVYGDSPIVTTLKDNAGFRSTQHQKINVYSVYTLDDINNYKPHIIFIPNSHQRNTNRLYKKIEEMKTNTLIITDSFNGLRNGGAINFYVEGDKLKFEMSLNNVRRFGLTPGNDLIRLSRLVD
jgi:hypothetical protein